MASGRYQPSKDFASKANIDAAEYARLVGSSQENPDKFWAELASAELDWVKPFSAVLDSSEAPYYQWFSGGKINLSYNCLDKQVASGLGDKTALIFEGEPGDQRRLSYSQLLEKVCQCANALKSLGINKGDVVCIYMPLCPEAIIAMQACARIGAIHSVVFAGFSAHALRERIIDGDAKLLITADGLYRKGNVINLIEIAAEAVKDLDLKQILFFDRIGDIKTPPGLALTKWSELVTGQNTTCEPIALDANDTSFILYTSGSTGKPKGIEHRTAGYLLWAKLTMKWVFDIKPDDIYWCTADVGWITGHTYVAYGPLAAGATQVIYEGAPNYPDKNRFWDLIEKYSVSIFYTAPTAIRTFIEWGEEYIRRHDLSSLRLLGSVGEPINPEVWQWYYRVIGKESCPIVDTWWQTETGGHLITTIPGVHEMRPGAAGKPLPGISMEVNEDGLLLASKPWPAMLKGIYKNPERYKQGYWSRVPSSYTAGDAALIDNDGYIQLAGRIDDVINVSGHRLGTAEIESALVTSDKVVEAAVVSIPHAIKGEGIIAYVVVTDNGDLEQELKDLVADSIGNFARPERVITVPALPKTRSGKIMRRILKDIAQGKEPGGDLSTIENPGIIKNLQQSSSNPGH